MAGHSKPCDQHFFYMFRSRGAEKGQKAINWLYCLLQEQINAGKQYLESSLSMSYPHPSHTIKDEQRIKYKIKTLTDILADKH